MRILATLTVFLLTAPAAWPLDIKSTGANKYSINGLSGFRKKSTDHYEVYYQRPPPASSFLSSFEKTWKEAATLLPNLSLMYKSGDLRAQMGRDEKGLLDRRKHTITPSPDGKPRKSFKTTVVFVDDRRYYERLAFSLHSPDEPEHRLVQAQETLAVVASYTTDGSVRVFWSQNPNLKILNSAAYCGRYFTEGKLVESLGTYMQFTRRKLGPCLFIRYWK